MTPNLPSVMRRTGLEPVPLTGGDFKSVPRSRNDNDLAPIYRRGAEGSGTERKVAEGFWLPIWLPVNGCEVAA
jgi:hypothetical protein